MENGAIAMKISIDEKVLQTGHYPTNHRARANPNICRETEFVIQNTLIHFLGIFGVEWR
jgi:hypothetical protein